MIDPISHETSPLHAPLTQSVRPPRKWGPDKTLPCKPGHPRSPLAGNERCVWLVLSETHGILIIYGSRRRQLWPMEAVMFALRLAALVLALLFNASARADDVADFYRGKEFRLIISASIGGGYDIYARAVARHLGSHIPGNPAVVPPNIPAAGGLRPPHHLQNVGAAD